MKVFGACFKGTGPESKQVRCPLQSSKKHQQNMARVTGSFFQFIRGKDLVMMIWGYE